MPKVVRCGIDKTYGHGEGSWCVADTNKTSNDKVFIFGIPIVVVGDVFTTHDTSWSSPHIDKKVLKGSTKVFIKGKSVVRKGDKLDCLDPLVEGSPRVFCG